MPLKSNKKMKPPLSRDLIVEILLRLPVKSLLRFKCVCKEWLSLISDPHFAKSHLDLAAAPTYRILVHPTYGYSVQSIDTESSLYNDSAVLNLQIPLPALNDSKFRILGCCRGFIVFDSNHGLILWNPLTNFNKYIPYYGGDYTCLSLRLNGLGYDVSTDDYLLVFVRFETNNHKDPKSSMQSWVTRFEIFSLKTKSWNRLEGTSFPKVHDGFRYRPYGSFFNGALHWLVLSSDRKYIDAIIAFDLKERSLSEIPMPQDLTMEVKRNTAGSELAIINGCFSLCCNSCSNAMVEIWMMKEYRIESSWTKSIVLSTSDIRGGSFLPMCFTKGGEIIGSINHEELAKFNDKGDLVERQRYKKGIYSQCAVYRENLLSRIVFDKKN